MKQTRCLLLWFSGLAAFSCLAAPPTDPAAFAEWRKQWPARDLSPRPDDGAHLALAVKKLKEGITPPRPFLIWAIGSSYCNMLGNGEVLTHCIRQRFPKAPEIVYKKHVGSAVPWQYLRGWADHVVIPEQPDLILIYTVGDPAHLDDLIARFRRATTADIIVPSIHWRMRGKANWEKSEDAPDQVVQQVRDVCAKHGVEFVENRREFREFMIEQKIPLEVNPEKGVLKDEVHESELGALIINENIFRHLAVNPKPAYDPATRERRIAASGKGPTFTAKFSGNRIDLIGHQSRDGGTAKIVIDGQPADQIAAFFRSHITPGAKNKRPERGSTRDISPHGIALGQNVVPQDWTIRMTSDQGDFQVEGSATGPDGQGNNQAPFVSKSGQILIDPELWRRSKDPKGTFANANGDTWTFSVTRSTLAAVSFRGETGSAFRASVAQNLPNGPHEIKIVAAGDGPIAIDAFDIFEPPLKE